MAAKAKLFVFPDFDCGTPSPNNSLNTPGAKSSVFYGENKENLDPTSFQYHGGFTPNTEKNRRPLGNIAVSTAVLDAWMADNCVCRWIVQPTLLLLRVRETARKPPRARKRGSDQAATDCSR